MDITKKIDGFSYDLSDLNISFDENLFERALNFIVNLDPEILDYDELMEAEEILSNLETLDEEIGVDEVKIAKKSSVEKKRLSRQYYRKNRQKVKLKRKKFTKSAEGKKRLRKKGVMARSGKTATGRRKVRYHT